MWEDIYQVTRLSRDEIAQKLSSLLEISFTRRDSWSVGWYFKTLKDRSEILITANWFDKGELVCPELPEGVFVTISGDDRISLLRDRLEGLSYLELFESTEF